MEFFNFKKCGYNIHVIFNAGTYFFHCDNVGLVCVAKSVNMSFKDHTKEITLIWGNSNTLGGSLWGTGITSAAKRLINKAERRHNMNVTKYNEERRDLRNDYLNITHFKRDL